MTFEQGRRGGDVDFLREGVRVLAQALMEPEVSQQTGAGKHGRTNGRVTQRNGYRERMWDTQAGAVELKLREDSYMPSLIKPRRRIDRAMLSVICVEIDETVRDFLTRPLLARYPYVWLDATYLKCRENSRVVSVAAVVATGVTEKGEREVLGLDIGPGEDAAFGRGS
ncbi:MAG: transposase [Coriobacteriia bacterium]